MPRLYTAVALICATALSSASSGSPFPYHVLIRSKVHFLPAHYCSGAIIAQNWVLTAAHCIYDDYMHPDNFTVYSGLSEYHGDAALQESKGFGESGKRVVQVITHFNHDPFNKDYYDLNWNYALVKTMAEFHEPDQVVPMVGRYFRPTGYAVATGFGLRDSKLTHQLKKSLIDVIASENCEAYHSYDQSKSNFCGGAFANCQQDFGSPLVRDGHLIGIFIHSHSRNCKRKQPGVYADVSKVRDWIDETISKFTAADVAPIENVHSVDDEDDSLEALEIGKVNAVVDPGSTGLETVEKISDILEADVLKSKEGQLMD